MSSEERAARLNLVRYGMLLVVVLAMTITPAALYLAFAPTGQPFSVLMPTIIATVLAAVVAGAVYMAYSRYLSQA